MGLGGKVSSKGKIMSINGDINRVMSKISGSRKVAFGTEWPC